MNEETKKIDYCIKKTSGTNNNSITTCSQVQYNKLNTSGNNPTISQKMLYAQYVRSSKSKTGFLK